MSCKSISTPKGLRKRSFVVVECRCARFGRRKKRRTAISSRSVWAGRPAKSVISTHVYIHKHNPQRDFYFMECYLHKRRRVCLKHGYRERTAESAIWPPSSNNGCLQYWSLGADWAAHSHSHICMCAVGQNNKLNREEVHRPWQTTYFLLIWW